MQRITQRALQPAPIHPVIGLQVPDGRLDRLAPAQPALLLRTQALVPASVNDLLVGVLGIHATKPQIDHDLLELDRVVLQQVRRLLQHRAQDVAVIRIAGEGARTQHQAVFVRDHHGALVQQSFWTFPSSIVVVVVGGSKKAAAADIHFNRIAELAIRIEREKELFYIQQKKEARKKILYIE